LARERPSPMRARISSRSNSANPPRTVSIRRPCALVVSAHVSPSEWNPALRSVIVARVFRRSRVELVERLEKLAAVGLGAADYLAEHLLASDLGRFGALAPRRSDRRSLCTSLVHRKKP
jgi:hypothetical protein